MLGIPWLQRACFMIQELANSLHVIHQNKYYNFLVLLFKSGEPSVGIRTATIGASAGRESGKMTLTKVNLLANQNILQGA